MCLNLSGRVEPAERSMGSDPRTVTTVVWKKLKKSPATLQMMLSWLEKTRRFLKNEIPSMGLSLKLAQPLDVMSPA